ncbi:unnamed protein product [Agarophyton chilense]
MIRPASRNTASSPEPTLYPAPSTPTPAEAPPRPPLAIPASYPQPRLTNRPSSVSQASTPAPSHPPRPSSAPTQPAKTEALPPGFEVLIQLEASVFENVNSNVPPPQHLDVVPALPPPQPPATLLVIQGPLAPDPQSSQMLYYAFINTRSYNFPLMPSTTCRRVGPKAFRIKVDHRRFVIMLAPSTSPKMVEGFIALLQWFCTWKDVDGSHVPARMDDSVSTASGASSAASSTRLLEQFGDKNVQMIEKVADRLNNKTQRWLEKKHISATKERERGGGKNVSLGGKITVGTLNATQKVVGTTAKVTGSATDKIASTVGRTVTRTVTKPLANAPMGSKRRRFYEQLASGCMAAGRIYVAGDSQARMYISNSTDSAALVTGAKYGSEAEHACRQLGQITVDAFRVWKFPSDLGFKSIMHAGVEEELKRKGESPKPPPPPTYANEPAGDSLVNPARKDSAPTASVQRPASNGPSFPSTPSSSVTPVAENPPMNATFPDESVMHVPFQDLSISLPRK